jgi:hypothetical protein
LVELADHDGDVDRAVELLSGGVEHIPYGSVIDRVLAAGRDAEALDWLDRAVAARRISTLQRNAGSCLTGLSSYRARPAVTVTR